MDAALDFVEAWLKGIFFFELKVFSPTPHESESEVAQSFPALWDPMDSSLHQASPSMGFSRQEYWSGLPFPSPGSLPNNPGIEPRSLSLWTDALLSQPPARHSNCQSQSMSCKCVWEVGLIRRHRRHPDCGLTGEGVEADWRGLPYRVDLLGIHCLWHFSSLRGVMPRGSHP